MNIIETTKALGYHLIHISGAKVIISSFGPDLVELYIDTPKNIMIQIYPCPFTPAYIPSQPPLALTFYASLDTGADYCRQNFGIEPEIVDNR